MKLNKKIHMAAFAVAAVVTLSTHVASGQAGVSSMSMGMSRSGVMPSAENIRVEEFINYHRHNIALPSGDRRVNLELKWSHISNDEAVLQVGLATPRALDPESIPPLNLVLVIDRSGSMSGDRISKVKQAILSFVESLRPHDLVSIVSFSSDATVDLESCFKTEQQKVADAVEGLKAGGNTNLHAGLMLGYQQAKKHLDPDRSNRVILLSDGISNQGVTDPDQIAKESKQFNRGGIDLTTIGLGGNFNETLLRQLADAGRGSIHFVGDAKDIQKTFVSELDSLLAPAARKVKLKIDFGDSSCKPSFFGYTPKKKDSRYTFKLDNLNHGATQVVLAKMKTKGQPKVNVSLTYTDAISGASKEFQEQVRLSGAESDSNFLDDQEVRKNYSIAMVANSLKVAASQCEQGKNKDARATLKKAIKLAKTHVERGDEDVDRMIKIARDHRKELKEAKQ